MKKRKDLQKIYSAVFIAMCTIPMLCFPFAPKNAELEKKALAETPQFIRDGALNDNFSQDCEAWLNDRLPFRSVVLSASSLVKCGLFKTDSANVIVGKKGWLFADAAKADYINSNPLTDERLRSIAVSLSLIEENVEGKNGHFVFVPMPNKASVYSEFMPSRYKKSDENNLTRLQKILAAEDISYIDMLKLMTDKKSFGVYHERDTHWNYYGALIGYKGIADALGKEHKLYDDTDYIPKRTWRGDLDKMIYPFIGFRDYQYNLNIQYEPFEFTVPAGVTDTQAQLEIFMSDKEENDKRIATRKTSSLGNGSLYMVRDSFGRALLPFFIDNYDTTLFVRADYPDLSNVTEGTDMIYEIVERNIGELFRTAPLMEAPVRKDVDYGTAAGEVVDFTWEEAEYGTRIYGELRKDMLSPDGRVYVRLTGTDRSVTYEAFPVYEEKLLGGEGEYGFSLIPDTSVLSAGEYQVEVICGGKTYSALSESPVVFSESSIKPAAEDGDTSASSDEDAPVPEAEWIEGGLADRAKVVYNGVTFSAGDNINDIHESLGAEAAPSSSAASCLTGELINEYYYAGMTIQTTEDGMIYSVEISENLHSGRTAKTAGGLQCGSTEADVISAFGDSDNGTYEEGDLKVQIFLRSEKVNAVLITIPES